MEAKCCWADLWQPRRRFTSSWQWDCGNPGDAYRFLPTALYEKSPAQSAEFQFVFGERGIRTYAFRKYHKIANY